MLSAHVGSCALSTGLTLSIGSAAIVRQALDEMTSVGERVIREQLTFSDSALRNGSNVATERMILEAWRDYYVGALARVGEIWAVARPADWDATIRARQERMRRAAATGIRALELRPD